LTNTEAKGSGDIFSCTNGFPDSNEWIKVRHVPGQANWHDANDNLSGTSMYGTPFDDDYAWSTQFNHIFYTHMLLSFGDNSEWLIAAQTDVNGSIYSMAARDIVKSSSSDVSY